MPEGENRVKSIGGRFLIGQDQFKGGLIGVSNVDPPPVLLTKADYPVTLKLKLPPNLWLRDGHCKL